MLSENDRIYIHWRWGILVALVLAVLASVPQVHLWLVRGSRWNGSYVSYDFDEPAYSAYVQALIDGRPRRNNPYTGRDDHSFSAREESHFSIQFFPAYLLAEPARLFGFSAGDMFIALRIASAFASGLAVFWLLSVMIRNEQVAAFGSLLVLCLGAYGSSAKGLTSLLTLYPDAFDFPFLRRFVPAVPFPIFFAFCTAVYKATTAAKKRAAYSWAVLGGLCFVSLLFSYFFLWTAAAAWFACLVLLSIASPAPSWRRLSETVAIVGAIALSSSVPYFLLIMHRVPTMDAALLLTRSRSPDFGQRSELLGLAVMVILTLSVRLSLIEERDEIIRVAVSFALLPFLVLNQQVVTGYSLQAFHYETYVAPYSASVAGFLTIVLLARRFLFRPSLYTPSICIGWCLATIIVLWAAIGTIITSRTRMASQIVADEKLAALKLVSEELAVPQEQPQPTRPIIFFTDLFQADLSPSSTPQAVLWSPHMFDFSGLTPMENKDRLYRYLYFSGVDARQFESMTSQNSYLSLALFGFERVSRREGGGSDGISSEDVLREQQDYLRFVSLFSIEHASALKVDYLVAPSQNGPDTSNLDRWYQRYEGHAIGDFTIYRLKLRQQ